MNIFVTSTCPVQSAKNLDDKRKIKMCLETAQLLATAIRKNGGSATYKATHINHPASIWVRKTRANYRWTLRHFAALCREYTRITGKIHGCQKYLTEFTEGAKVIPKGKLTKFANCAANQSKGISYKHIQDITLAYQMYLNDRWNSDVREPTWS